MIFRKTAMLLWISKNIPKVPSIPPKYCARRVPGARPKHFWGPRGVRRTIWSAPKTFFKRFIFCPSAHISYAAFFDAHRAPECPPEAPRGRSGHPFWELWKGFLGCFLVFFLGHRQLERKRRNPCFWMTVTRILMFFTSLQA